MPKKIAPIEKRAGKRMVVRRRPTTKKTDKYENFRDTKQTGIFPKKMAQYRFIFFTNFEPDEMLFLSLFLTWIKINETFFENRNNFPIYGFVVNNSEIKVRLAQKYINILAETLEWDNSEHHLYNGYKSCLKHIWTSADFGLTLEKEEKIIEKSDPHPEIKLVENYIEEIIALKPENLIAIYLRSPKQLFEKNIRMSEYFNKIITISYDYQAENLASVKLYTNYKQIISPENMPKFFRNLCDQENEGIGDMIKKAMFIWNDNRLKTLLNRLAKYEEFKECDMEDYYEVLDIVEKSDKHIERIEEYLSLIKNNSKEFCIGPVILFVLMLAGNKTLKIPVKIIDIGDNTKTIEEPDKILGDIEKMLISALSI